MASFPNWLYVVVPTCWILLIIDKEPFGRAFPCYIPVSILQIRVAMSFLLVPRLKNAQPVGLALDPDIHLPSTMSKCAPQIYESYVGHNQRMT